MSVHDRDYERLIKVEIHSFGYLHNDMPSGDGLTIDLRHKLRDPHTSPAMREMTGLDPVVRDLVRNSPGAYEVTSSIVRRTLALLHGHADERRELVRVFIGCQGGRHRSVAIADYAAAWLRDNGIGVDVIHTHVDRSVVHRPIGGPQ
jgi:RNase adaptor protein for sRNA GlmZ degradation